MSAGNGPYSLGGFKGKGKGRLAKQRPSKSSGSASYGVLALAVAFVALPVLTGVAVVGAILEGYGLL